jgi:hypothetical protein
MVFLPGLGGVDGLFFGLGLLLRDWRLGYYWSDSSAQHE